MMRQLCTLAVLVSSLFSFSTSLHAAQISLANQQWMLLTVPANADEQTIESLFGDDLAIETLGTDWAIYLLDQERQLYVAPDRSDSLKQGEGFWIIQVTGASITIDVPDTLPQGDLQSSTACASPLGCFQVDLPASASATTSAILGAPFDQAIIVDDIRMQNNQQSCVNGCSLSDATAGGLLYGNQWTYDSGTSTYRPLVELTTVQPWQAFWVSTQNVSRSTEPSLLLPKTTPTISGNEIAAFTTKSGTWRVATNGPGFLWTLDERPGWSSAMACNDTEQTKVVNVANWTLLVPQHACKFAQDENPVQMDSSLIRQAIEDRRWVAYDTDSAADWPISFGIPANQTGSLQSYTESQYDPAGMNGESSSVNIVGVISAQGGEYATSRGAIDNADAQLFTKAINGESIESYTEAMYNIAFASAGYPYRTPFVGTMLRDPQKPPSGLQYEYKINPVEVTDEIYSVTPPTAWKYNASHLTNVGWALWLATEDPRIGMIVQSAAQFTLATRVEGYRLPFMQGGAGNVSDYRCNVLQDRSIYNCLNGMWRARDVAQRTRSSDTILWSLDRVNEMYAETEAQIQSLMDEVSTATVSDARAYALNVSSSPFNGDYSTHCAGYQRSDSSEFTALARSNFMDAQYGGVPMYLRAKKGEPLGNELLAQVANHMITRVLYLGGAAGVDGRRDLRGSSLPIGPCVVNEQYGNLEAGPLPFTDRNGWVDWVETLDITTVEGLQPPTNSFNNANAHTTVQIGFILKAAKQMVATGRIPALTDLDAAIAAMELARQNTEEGQLRFGIWTKHMATTN